MNDSAPGLTVRVGFSTSDRLHLRRHTMHVHPGSPSGWDSQQGEHHQIVSENLRAPGLTVRVGFSTSRGSRDTPASTSVHPGSPSGWDSQLRRNPRVVKEPLVCTRAHRPGGILNSSDRIRPCRLVSTCTRAHRPGGILNVRSSAWTLASMRCTRAHRPGGILNLAGGQIELLGPCCAPGLTVRVGFSTTACIFRCISQPPVHPGSPSGWDSQHHAALAPRVDALGAPGLTVRVGFSTLGVFVQSVLAREVHPGSPSGWDSQRLHPHRSPRQWIVHPGSPSGWDSQHPVSAGVRLRGRAGAPGLTVRVGFSTISNHHT